MLGDTVFTNFYYFSGEIKVKGFVNFLSDGQYHLSCTGIGVAYNGSKFRTTRMVLTEKTNKDINSCDYKSSFLVFGEK